MKILDLNIVDSVRSIIRSQINNVGLVELGRLKSTIDIYLNSIEDYYFVPCEITEEGILRISGYKISSKENIYFEGNIKDVIRTLGGSK